MNSKDFVSEITEHLTGEKADVAMQEDEHGAILTVSPKGNISALIGKAGSTINSIRLLCKAIGQNGKHRIKLNVSEDKPTNRS
jgi:predicted RNA-binding protein YlqC (UPF0109 family)